MAGKHRSSSSDHLSSKDLSSLAHKASGSIADIFTQTTIHEKIIVVASVLAIIFTLMPWATIGSITIRGVSHFMYLIGFIIIASCIYAIADVIASLYGKSLHNFIDSPSKLHMLLGFEIIQLGLIAFTVFNGFSTVTDLFDNIDMNVNLVIFCGLAILAAGLYENAQETRPSKKTIVHPEKTDSKAHIKELLKQK